MTTKVKLIIAQSALIAYTILVIYILGNPHRHNPLHEAPQRHARSASSHTVSLKGKYKVEEQKGDCPVCQEEGIAVVKPFQCGHTLCEACLEGMLKAHITGNATTFAAGPFGELSVTYPVNLVCPQCRAELKRPTQ